MKASGTRQFLIIATLILIGGMWQIIALLMEQRPITNAPAKGTRIVMLGDSLTVGVGASTPERGFVPMLSSRLNTPLIGKGVSGDTTRDAKLRLQDVIAEHPDIVIILLGGNDYLRQIPPEETFANLHDIITTIQAQGSVVVLLGVRGGLLTDHFAHEFETLAHDTGSVYVPDVLDGIIGDASLLADEIHPNDRGYEKMVDKVAPTVLGIILSATPPPANPSDG